MISCQNTNENKYWADFSESAYRYERYPDLIDYYSAYPEEKRKYEERQLDMERKIRYTVKVREFLGLDK